MASGRPPLLVHFPLYILLLSVLYGLAYGQSRYPRSLYQFEQVVKCAMQMSSGWDAFKTYNCYGCWCGKGHKDGMEPVDEIDACCMRHDQCYTALNDAKTCRKWTAQVYLASYEFECQSPNQTGTTTPKPAVGPSPICKTAETECAKGECACDVEFAKCIRQFKVGEKKKCPRIRFSCLLG